MALNNRPQDLTPELVDVYRFTRVVLGASARKKHSASGSVSGTERKAWSNWRWDYGGTRVPGDEACARLRNELCASRGPSVKGKFMKTSKPLFPFVFILFLLGLGGLIRFSQNVRSVDVVGLFFSGAACGAAAAALIMALRARTKIQHI